MVRLISLLSGLAAFSLVAANLTLEQGISHDSLPAVREAHQAPNIIPETPVLDSSVLQRRAGTGSESPTPKPPSNTKTVLYLHAAGASIAWAVLMPIGAAIRKTTTQARYHGAIMTAATLLAVTSLGAGIVISLRNPDESSFISAHQILGLILVPLAVLQGPMGLYNHHVYLRTGKPTLLGTVHKYLGPALVVVGVLNGYLGIDFAEDEEYVKPYVVTVVVWLFCLSTGAAAIRRFRRRGPEGVKAGVIAPGKDVVGGAETGQGWA